MVPAAEKFPISGTAMDIAIMKRLPEEIIDEILSKSLVKSLLRFRCVSKPWCSLISSPRFVKTHLQNSLKNPIPFSDEDVMEFEFMQINWIRKAYSSGSFGRPLFVTNRDLEYNQIEMVAKNFMPEYANVALGNSKGSWFVGCCNGLSCLFIKEKIYLFNPCTRESFFVPLTKYESYYQVEGLGFGCDEFNDDYKVLARLLGSYNDDDGEQRFKYIVTVYSFKTNSWKLLKKQVEEKGYVRNYDDQPDAIGKFIHYCSEKAGKLLVGKIHFGSSSYGNGVCIFSFDLSSEVFGIIELPSSEGSYNTVEVVKECLCVLNYCREGEWSDVWIMKEYGVKDSWYKAFRFPHGLVIPRFSSHEPIYITEDLEILYKDNRDETSKFYDPKTKSVRHPVKRNSGGHKKGEIHIQSLVSPFPDGVDKRALPGPIIDEPKIGNLGFPFYAGSGFKAFFISESLKIFCSLGEEEISTSSDSDEEEENSNNEGEVHIQSLVPQLPNDSGASKRSFSKDKGPILERGMDSGKNGSSRVRCYNCNQEGHYARDCGQKRVSKLKCYNCNQEGHYARDCTKPRKEQNNMSAVNCYNCNKKGHYARDCNKKGAKF